MGAQLYTNKYTLDTELGPMDVYQANPSEAVIQTPEGFEYRGIEVSFSCRLVASELWEVESDGLPYFEGWGPLNPSLGWKEDGGCTPWQRGIAMGDLCEAAHDAYLDFIYRHPQWLSLCAVTEARNSLAQAKSFADDDPSNVKLAALVARRDAALQTALAALNGPIESRRT